MSALDDWTDAVREALDLDPFDANIVLDVARDVAHGVMRPAAPLSAYLLGLQAAVINVVVRDVHRVARHVIL